MSDGGSKMKKELILYVIQKATKEYDYIKIDKLQIVKILYLIDKLSLDKTGEKLSEYDYLLERLGPLAWEILSDLSSLKEERIIGNSDNPYDFILIDEKRVEEIIRGVSEQVEKKIGKAEINRIFNLAKNLSKLLDYVHSLDEVKKSGFKEKVL